MVQTLVSRVRASGQWQAMCHGIPGIQSVDTLVSPGVGCWSAAAGNPVRREPNLTAHGESGADAKGTLRRTRSLERKDSHGWWNSPTGSARLVRRASRRTIRYLTSSRRRSCRLSWLRSVPGASTTLSLSSTASSALSFASSFFFSASFFFSSLLCVALLLLREGDQRDAQHPQPCHECSSTEGALHNLPLPRT